MRIQSVAWLARRARQAAVLGAVAAGTWWASMEGVAAGEVVFSRDVLPLLADRCFQCHGPDEKARKAGLRLDVEAEAKGDHDGTTAVAPGDVDASELIHRVLSGDPDEVMPPPEIGKPVTAREADLLKQWISEGARWGRHWAFESPRRPDLPELSGDGEVLPDGVDAQSLNPIDRFILARLEREALRASPEADRATQLRRLSLDLTGLPPSGVELGRFLADASPGAYERVVDRILASPHFGERMALEWLDYARFADSNGYQSDGSRTMWAWRDWLVGAFNRNLAFDQFTIEQLAGDLLADPTRDQLIATGFNRNHRLNGEGGIIAEEWRVETVIDRVETTGLTWLALTLNCARCHDHKYDPVSQKEFYQLFAFFNNVDESGVLSPQGKTGENTPPLLAVPGPEHEVRLAELHEAVREAEAAKAAATRHAESARADWESALREAIKAGSETSRSAWTMLEPTAVESTGGSTLTRQPDGSWLASGGNPDTDTYVVTAPVPGGGRFSGVLIEALPDPSLPDGSLGRYANGNFVLTGLKAAILGPGRPELPIDFAAAAADYEQNGYPAAAVIDDDPESGWAIDGNQPDKRVPRRAQFLAAAAIDVPADATIRIEIVQASRFGRHGIGRFRVSATGADPAKVSLDGGGGPPAEVVAALEVPAAGRDEAQQSALDAYWSKASENPVVRADAGLAAARKALAEFEGELPVTMVMRELPQARDAFVLSRGEYEQRREKVTAGVPAALPPIGEGEPMNRLGLARWIVRADHPLTARVWVNREWARLFGTGIVKTLENFGTQAEFPSHPELLDWLAVEFVESGWDMKAMIRLMVTSRAYRQSAVASAELVERDPENRLLARGPRFRLPGEILRDQALAVSGLLVRDIGGPSVRPYMPEGVWDETSRYGNLRNYRHESGPGLHRRTIYTIWKRTAGPPTLLLFDAPTREACTIKRSRTNTPLQALALLNEITFVEASRVFAERIIREGGATEEERLAWAFREALAREPDPEEARILLEGLRRRLGAFRADPASASALLSHGDAPLDESIDPIELAAYAMTANVIFNLDEFVTR